MHVYTCVCLNTHIHTCRLHKRQPSLPGGKRTMHEARLVVLCEIMIRACIYWMHTMGQANCQIVFLTLLNLILTYYLSPFHIWGKLRLRESKYFAQVHIVGEEKNLACSPGFPDWLCTFFNYWFRCLQKIWQPCSRCEGLLKALSTLSLEAQWNTWIQVWVSGSDQQTL